MFKIEKGIPIPAKADMDVMASLKRLVRRANTMALSDKSVKVDPKIKKLWEQIQKAVD